jgi:hypothetical protein
MCLIITHFQERTQLLITHKQMAFIVTEWYLLTIATCIPIARQRLGKRIPATTVYATIGLLLSCNGAGNMPSQQLRIRCFLCGSRRA